MVASIHIVATIKIINLKIKILIIDQNILKEIPIPINGSIFLLVKP